jgi:hypothetical protein
MRAQGASLQQIEAAARADGLDAITRIRLIRKVCGITLAEAKSVTGAAQALDAKQEAAPGATVYWEGWDTVQGFYVMQARVTRVVGDKVHVADHKKHLITPTGLEEAAIEEPTVQTIPLGYFDKPLADRLGESLRFVLELRDLTPA